MGVPDFYQGYLRNPLLYGESSLGVPAPGAQVNTFSSDYPGQMVYGYFEIVNTSGKPLILDSYFTITYDFAASRVYTLRELLYFERYAEREFLRVQYYNGNDRMFVVLNPILSWNVLLNIWYKRDASGVGTLNINGRVTYGVF